MMNNAMDRPVISDTMEEDKTAAGFLPARIGFPLKKVKIIRYLLLLSVIILQIFPKEIDFRSMVILLTGLYTFHILFYSYCAATKQDHFFNSMIFITSDLVMTAAFTLFLDFFLLLPFISLQTVELVMEKQKRAVISLFAGLLTVLTTAGFVLRGETGQILYAAGALLSLVLLVKMIRLKDRKENREYEYMKNLVDNKNKLLSTLTHELRTPLAVIKTSNELIMEERPGPLNETQKSLVSSSLENTKRLNALVENILSQVKVEFAWFSIKQQPLDIRTIIRKTALDIKPYLETRRQTLRYHYPALLSKTLGDRRWLEQVLLNLIHNGSKNSPEDSELTITVQENEQCVVVSVHDRGMGIENREISQVFNEFYQSTDPAKNLNEGAGLGLTIVKDIIEKHRGKVYISSLPQAGTTVSFTLPLYKGVFSGTNNSDN